MNELRKEIKILLKFREDQNGRNTTMKNHNEYCLKRNERNEG